MVDRTFDVEVDGIGTFTFRRRAIRSQFLIEAEASRLLGGPVNDELLRAGAVAFAALSVLTVHSPPGWDLEALDPFAEADAAESLLKVHGALREAEGRFREQSKAGSQGLRPAA